MKDHNLRKCSLIDKGKNQKWVSNFKNEYKSYGWNSVGDKNFKVHSLYGYHDVKLEVFRIAYKLGKFVNLPY